MGLLLLPVLLVAGVIGLVTTLSAFGAARAWAAQLGRTRTWVPAVAIVGALSIGSLGYALLASGFPSARLFGGRSSEAGIMRALTVGFLWVAMPGLSALGGVALAQLCPERPPGERPLDGPKFMEQQPPDRPDQGTG